MNFNDLNLPSEIKEFYKTAKLNEISDSLIFGYNVFMNCKKETEKKILSENSGDKIAKLERDKEDLYGQINLIRDKERDYYLTREKIYREEIIEIKLKLENRNSQIESMGSEEMLNNLLPNFEIIPSDSELGFEILTESHKILYLNNHSKGEKKISKHDLENLRQLILKGDYKCGIISSENGGISGKKDLDVEIIENKPIIFLHFAKKNSAKIKIAALILLNIINNDMKFDVSILEKVRDLIKESNSIGRIYTINKNNIESLTKNNEELGLINKKLKYSLQNVVKELIKRK